MKSSKNLIPKLLVLIANRQALDPADIGAIAQKILQSRPEIRIFVVDPRDTAEFVPNANWNNPAVSISFGPPGRFIPKRGRILQNKQIAKVDQFARMKAAGISTPHTERFEFGKHYDKSLFGEFSVLKPLPLALTSHGDTARLYRTHRLTDLRYESLPEDHILRSSPCIVQQFIDTGQYPQKWRVLTLFGRPLYCNLSRSFAPRASLDAEDDVIELIHR